LTVANLEEEDNIIEHREGVEIEEEGGDKEKIDDMDSKEDSPLLLNGSHQPGYGKLTPYLLFVASKINSFFFFWKKKTKILIIH